MFVEYSLPIIAARERDTVFDWIHEKSVID